MNASSSVATASSSRITRLSLASASPREIAEHPPTKLLNSLGTSFESIDSARRWLQNAARTLVDWLGIDRAEILAGFANGPLTVECSWPTTSAGTRLALELGERHPWIAAHLAESGIVWIDDVAELPLAAAHDRDACRETGVASAVVVALSSADGAVGILSLTSSRPFGWTDRQLGTVQAIGQAAAGVLCLLRSVRASKEARRENAALRDQIESDNVTRPDPEFYQREIVGRSPAILRTLGQVEQVAPTASTVLLLGETGTGKELIARAIHNASPQRNRSMVRVNCGALPSTLIESELFGREKGAYTGALSRQAGRFELADGSTIFLDEVGELAPEVQVKLLRVLQEGEFERIGSTTTQKVKVRVIAATNKDLARAVREGRFREDLFYRLNVFPMRIPPVRDRREDIPLLVWAFAEEFARSMGHQVERISRATMDALQAYSWPGNVRELRNVIERAMILHRGPTLQVEVPENEATEHVCGTTLEEVERRHMLGVLQSTNWRIRGKNGAADVLGLKPTTLESRLAKLGIRRPLSGATVD